MIKHHKLCCSMTTDPGDSLFNGTSQCPSELFKDPKPTFLMKNLQEIFIQFSLFCKGTSDHVFLSLTLTQPSLLVEATKRWCGSYEADVNRMSGLIIPKTLVKTEKRPKKQLKTSRHKRKRVQNLDDVEKQLKKPKRVQKQREDWKSQESNGEVVKEWQPKKKRPKKPSVRKPKKPSVRKARKSSARNSNKSKKS